jgi:hypothetical protein
MENADNLMEIPFKVSSFSVHMRHIVGRMMSEDPKTFSYHLQNTNQTMSGMLSFHHN